MGIRQAINEKPALTAGVAIAVVVAALLLVVRQLVPSRPKLPTAGAEAFYTTDDGAIWFVDSADKVPPFDHNGKVAVTTVKCPGRNTGTPQPVAPG